MLVLGRPAPILVLALWGLGCGAHNTDVGLAPVDQQDTAPEASAARVALEPTGTLTMLPGEVAELHVLVTPPGALAVRLVLLGEALDASLDADTRVTDEGGRAAVTLTAPSAATTFRLRATVDGGSSAQVGVSVSGQGFASLLVRPVYTGIRETSSWVASATAHAGCADLPGMPPDDGPIVHVGAADGDVRLDALPVGPRIAVTMRSFRAVGGCVDVTGLEPGEQRVTEVQVADTPVDAASMNLAMELALTPNGAAWQPVLHEARDLFLDALFAPNRTQASTLLGAMR